MLFVAFPLLFNISSLKLSCVNLINMCLAVFFLEFILYGTFFTSWTWLFPFLC